VHPQLALFGGLSTWTVLAVIATIVAVVSGLVAERQARAGLPNGLLVELVVVVVAGGWLSAKIGHVLFEARGHALPGGAVADGVIDLVRADPWHWARLLEPGFVQLAGVIGAIAVGVLFLWRQRVLDALPVLADAAAVAVAAGVAIGRLGCFLAGCCYGAPTTLPWAVHFPAGHETGGVGVHPTQLYDAGAAVLALVVWAALRRRRVADGQAALVVTGLVLGARFATELLRADADRGQIGPLSTSQALAVGGVAAVVMIALARSRLVSARGSPSTTDTNPLT
jgi:phosphatidylglycerol:prolipoprotein diacylglycerol transferase